MSKIIGVQAPFTSKKAGWEQTIAANVAVGANDFHANRVYNGERAIVTKVGIWFSPIVHAAGIKITMGVYSGSGNFPSTKMAQTAEYTTNGTEGGRIVILDLLTPVVFNAKTEYYVCHHANAIITIERAAGPFSSNIYGHVFYNVAYNATLPTTFAGNTLSGGMLSVAAY